MNNSPRRRGYFDGRRKNHTCEPTDGVLPSGIPEGRDV
jgi:hypothetical protein